MATTYPDRITLPAEVGPVQARVRIPGSKSITNRALLMGALARGETRLIGPLHSDDTHHMTACLRQLGVAVEEQSDGDVVIRGGNRGFAAPNASLHVGNSGTTIRFLTAAAAFAPAGADVTLDGIPRMRQRPIGQLLTALAALGVSCESIKGDGYPPVRVHGGGLPGGSCDVDGTISSQYLSALLMTAPYAETDVIITVQGDLVSKPYADLTIAMMEAFGVSAQHRDYRVFTVPSNQCYLGRSYEIEPDASNATYFLAAAAVTGGTVTVDGLGTDSLQGDIAFVDALEKMGCRIARTAHSLTVTGPDTLSPVDLNLEAIPDTAQTLAVCAAFASGPSRLTGLQTLRVKETDRISAVALELSKIGARVHEGDDHWIIEPAFTPRAALIGTYDDHRMAMSFAVAGLRIANLAINDPGCVAKTFPDFWTRWEAAFYPNGLAE